MALIDDRRLIERYVTTERVGDPGKAYLRETGVPVWALVGHWRSIGEDADDTALSYDLPLEAVEAALAYYRQNSCVIDARLAAIDAAA